MVLELGLETREIGWLGLDDVHFAQRKIRFSAPVQATDKPCFQGLSSSGGGI
jgi:hypothetical protein